MRSFIAISFRVESQRDRVGCKCCLCVCVCVCVCGVGGACLRRIVFSANNSNQVS